MRKPENKEMVTIELPNVKYKNSFIECIHECRKYLDVPETPSNNWWRSWAKFNIENLENDFENFVKDRLDTTNGYLAKRWQTEVHTYWIIANGEFQGQIEIRPNMDISLPSGHVGVCMRPSAFGKGYAFRAAGALKVIFKKLGLEKIKVSCDITNKASHKLISGCVRIFGGYQEEGVVESDINGKHYHIYRFWINVL